MTKKKCCCGGAAAPNSFCDCCPQPLPNDPPFTMPAWQLTLTAAGQVSCATGTGSVIQDSNSVGGALPCVCGTCAIGALSSDNLRCNTFSMPPFHECEVPSHYLDLECGYFGLWTCDECPPLQTNPPSPGAGGTLTLRTYGCKPPAVEDDFPCSNLVWAGGPGNPNNCECCTNAEVCEGNDNNPYWDFDDVPDGISYFSRLYRCVRRQEACCSNIGGQPHPTDVRNWTMFVVIFYAENAVGYCRLFNCEQIQPGAWQTTCTTSAPYILQGQSWYCVYAAPVDPCEYYAVGGYRLVYVNTSGCLGALGALEVPECQCGDCVSDRPTVLCDWDGVKLPALQSVWQPPATITVTRIQ